MFLVIDPLSFSKRLNVVVVPGISRYVEVYTQYDAVFSWRIDPGY